MVVFDFVPVALKSIVVAVVEYGKQVPDSVSEKVEENTAAEVALL
jgi:hypothetical protein